MIKTGGRGNQISGDNFVLTDDEWRKRKNRSRDRMRKKMKSKKMWRGITWNKCTVTLWYTRFVGE